MVEQREETGRDVIRLGAKVGVGGIRDGETTKARLILVG